MGQKVHPKGFRLGITTQWDAQWFNEKKYSEYILEDEAIRDFVKKTYNQAGIARVFVQRPDAERVLITIYAARPGILIGKKGAGITELRQALESKFNRKFGVDIVEVKNARNRGKSCSRIDRTEDRKEGKLQDSHEESNNSCTQKRSKGYKDNGCRKTCWSRNCKNRMVP